MTEVFGVFEDTLDPGVYIVGFFDNNKQMVALSYHKLSDAIITCGVMNAFCEGRLVESPEEIAQRKLDIFFGGTSEQCWGNSWPNS